MTQIIVTLEDNVVAANIMKAIEMLKGVVRISVYNKENETQSEKEATVTKQYSPRVQRLRGIAKGITSEQIEEDERLAYLLSK